MSLDDAQWLRMPQQLVEQLREIVIERPNPAPPNVRVMLSRIEVPVVPRQEEDIPRLKQQLTHIWIFIHNINEKMVKRSKDYQQFAKMYEKSKYMMSRFSVHIDSISRIIELNRDLDLTIKCYVRSPLVTNDDLWKKIRNSLEGEPIGQIIVKSLSEISQRRQQERRLCEKRFTNQFKYPQRYSGFVQNFNDALQLQKKILNLAMSNSKPNFFIINEYETIEATENLNSFHDILINTKAYLKESLQMKSKESVLSSLMKFQQFTYQQLEEYYQLELKQKTQKQILEAKNKEIDILRVFFIQTKQTINRYPFSNEDQMQFFYDSVIKLYSEQTIVYKSVNHLCKTITSKEVFMKIAFFCKFLNLAIKYKARKNLKHSNPRKYQKLFRGAMMSEIEMQSLKNLINKKQDGYIINLAFISTSISKNVGRQFLKRGRNNLLIKIRINELFWNLQKINEQPFSSYLQYFIDANYNGVGQAEQQEVLFNCYNVFKVINFYQEEKLNVLELEAFSHLQIIQKKIAGKQITDTEQKILDVIVRVQKGRDYAEQLKEQGKTVEMVEYLDKVVENGVDLNVNQAESYIKFMVENGKEETVEKFIEKVQDKAEKTIQQEMKLAVYESIKEDYLETQLLLESISNKMEEQEQKKKLNMSIENLLDEYVQQSWVDLMNKMNLKFTVAVNKQKIGAYEEFFQMVDEIMEKLHPEVKISQFIQNMETWGKFLKYLEENNATERHSSRLRKLYKQYEEIRQKYERYNKNKEKMMSLNEQIKQFLSIETERDFFISVFENEKKRQFVIEHNQLRRDIEVFKNKFYERAKLKIKILIYYYEILIKCERLYLFKSGEDKKEQSKFIKTLFELYFQNNQRYFEQMHMIYKVEENEKYHYEKAIYFKQYAKFLNGLTFFSNIEENQKINNRKSVQKLFQKAREIVAAIYDKHEQIVNIQSIQDNIAEERLFSEKINKKNSILESIRPNSEGFRQSLKQEELVDLVETLKRSRFESAKAYSSKNSILNQNLCYSSVLNTTIRVVEQSLNSIDLKQKYNYDFQRLANKISSNMEQNAYLKQHTSNSFNFYLRAAFQFFRGFYEASMVYIGKSEEILDVKLKSTEQRIASQADPAKKQILQNKLKTIKQNNQVRIKICILKSRICINYKPNIHSLCITNLRDQQIFIRQKLFESNSALPQIYYYTSYLIFLEEKTEKEKLASAFKILIPESRRNNSAFTLKKELLKYYELQYYMGNAHERMQVAERIEKLAVKHRIAVENVEAIKLETIQEHEIYYLFKIQALTITKQTFLILIFERCFKNFRNASYKVRLDRLYRDSQIMRSLFAPNMMKYWQMIDRIINIKFDRSILVSHRLFLFYFLYLQHLISSIRETNLEIGLRKLAYLIRKLQVVMEDSENNKVKFQIPRNNNSGFEDKIKLILYHVYKFMYENWSPVSGILRGEIYQQDFEKLRQRFFRPN